MNKHMGPPALRYQAKQSSSDEQHKCYDQALAEDSPTKYSWPHQGSQQVGDSKGKGWCRAANATDYLQLQGNKTVT